MSLTEYVGLTFLLIRETSMTSWHFNVMSLSGVSHETHILEPYKPRETDEAAGTKSCELRVFQIMNNNNRLSSAAVVLLNVRFHGDVPPDRAGRTVECLTDSC